ncbi:MAG: hypothetical protein RML12_06305 [Xanthomonadales bacterium]|nr:hypothetical protein [Xanthomonadales bacterium]
MVQLAPVDLPMSRPRALRVLLLPLAAMAIAPRAAASEPDQLDGGFGSAGRVTVAFDLGGNNADVAIRLLRRNDGRYLAVGTATAAAGVRVALAQLLKTGQLDSGFGTGGKLSLDLCMSEVTDAALDASGRILILGNTVACGTAGSVDGRLARLTPAGTLDPSFSGGGVRNITYTTVTDAEERSYALVLRANGEILVGGGVDVDGSGSTHLEQPALRHLDANGHDLSVIPGVSTTAAGRLAAGRALPDGGVVWAVDRDQALGAGTAAFWRMTAALADDTAFGPLGLRPVQTLAGETGCDTATDHRVLALVPMRGTFKMLGGVEVGGVWRAWFASVDDAAGGPNLRIRCLTASLPSGVFPLAAAYHPGADPDRLVLGAVCGSTLSPQFCALGLRLANPAAPALLELDPAFNGGLPLTIQFAHAPTNPGPRGGAIAALREPGGRSVLAGWRQWFNADFDFAAARLGRGLFKDGFETSD